MDYTTLSVRISSEEKDQFDAFCKATGLNTSVAISMFIKAVLREHRIPFEISTEPTNVTKTNEQEL